MQKRAAISGLILAQLGGIDEEAVRGREQQPHAETHARQAEGLQVFHDDRGLGILAAEIFANLRYKFGEDLRSEDPEAAIAVEELKAFGLPGMGLGVRLLLATSDRFFVYPTKLREYQARYRGSFLHGGVTPEEVILPVALLTPRGRSGGGRAGGGGTR